MAADLVQPTRASLLARLRDPDNRPAWEQAWQRFFDQYAPLMLAWCRRWGLQDSDAEDVTANVLLRLGERLKNFAYDPTRRFRSWLRTVVHNEVRDFFARKAGRPGDAGGGGALDAVPDREAAADELCREIEDKRVWLARAMEVVRLSVEPHTWEAFHRTAVEGRGGAAVAAELGMKVDAVYQARRRVFKLIQQAVDQPPEEPPTP